MKCFCDQHFISCSQDHPYLFTLKNSGLPQAEVPPSEDNSDQVPMWSVIVASIGGVALGCAIVGVAMSIKSRRRRNKKKMINDSGSSF